MAAIWAFSVVMVLAAAALLLSGAAGGSPVVGSLRIPFWALLPGFAAAERLVVHVHFRRSAHSMSLGEIPLVFGLLFATGPAVMFASVLGRLIVLAVHRRLPPIRLAFNLGQILLGTCLTVIVFHAVAATSTEIGPSLWGAAGLATVTNSLVAVLAISVAVSLTEGALGWRQIASSLRTDIGVTLANTSLGLCAATLVYRDWRTAFLMAVPVVGMFATFRAYTSERRRHDRLEFLYETTRALSRAGDIEPALEALLSRALEAFRAEIAEIVLFSPAGTEGLRVSVRAGDPAAAQTLSARVADHVRGLLRAHGRTACATGDLAGTPLFAHLESRGLESGMFALLEGERGCIGAMTIGTPSGLVDRFTAEDVKLFEALANNTSVALENERLGQTVWRMTEVQRELEHQASHDPLTDLANRMLFSERVDTALRQDPARVSVIFIDIDDFKGVNDTLGHAAGDELLVTIARRLTDCVRPEDTLARLGGDEFAILLEAATSREEAIEVAERINRRMAERFAIAGQTIAVRVSAGIATGGESGMTADELIRNADVAMYRAKQAAKHGYEVFEADAEAPVVSRRGAQQRLREAVREEKVDVHYQPIVELAGERVMAYEALARWPGGPRGCTDPNAFLPMAEEMGALAALGRSVLRQACREAMRWPPLDGLLPDLHVNVSPVELSHPAFVDGVAAILQRSGLEPDRLVLEITEGVVLRDPEEKILVLERLRALGVRLALDDFGTGYSSLSHLRALPIDWLKIGRPFLDQLRPGSADRSFMRMILDLAATLDLDVIAEGIEHPDQLTALRDLGCRFGQGFLLGAPARPATAALALPSRAAGG
jgi:diguanylate cyclase (GGDEF)-like protein